VEPLLDKTVQAFRLPVTKLAGIGVHTAQRLEKLGIHSILDLIFHLPHRYEDRTKIVPIGSLVIGEAALVCGQLEHLEVLTRGKKSLICRISDRTGGLSLRFFHYTASQYQALQGRSWVLAFAEVRQGYAELEMVHPDFSVFLRPELAMPETGLTPVYPLTEGLSQTTMRKAVKRALVWCQQHPDALIDWLPDSLMKPYGFPTLVKAVFTLHAHDAQQPSEHTLHPALKRLALEELLAHHLSLQAAKAATKVWQAPVLAGIDQHLAQFTAGLAFQLTQAQQRVIEDIRQDCRQASPMLRLVQGDVGSGKTIVAAYAALIAISSGYQVALMAPTELLAEQHHRNFNLWFAAFNVQVQLLTGQLKGKARQALLQQLHAGHTPLLIGTHALFQDTVQFHNLGLIVIDEQQRFGVQQRLALREKVHHEGMRPHQLIMTATPIPRTLAMLAYSDLDSSIIDELPPGRQPVVTSVISAERRQEVIDRIHHWVAKQRQAYWVCTLIEESDVLECQAAEQTAQLLTEMLTGIRIGLVHGRMKATEKEAIMLAFKTHELDLLVATTVIEVGVDVPNAGLMVIENPERLGLSQLHQLRGRVGRGEGDSYCVLMYQAPLSAIARERLGILRATQDGFVIAEKDLQLRGPGDVMGTRQTGLMQFKIANLERDTELIATLPELGSCLLAQHPEALTPLCERWLGHASRYAEV
jgi:ATP-dependent DNA helicase RecG